MVTLVKKFIRTIDVGSSILAVSSIVAIFALMVSVSIDVSMREGVGKPVPGLFEGTELLLVVAIFFGMAIEQRKSGHIKVTVITELMPPAVKLFFKRTALIISAIMILWIAIQTGERAIASFATSEVRWGTIQFPVWPVRASITIGLVWYFAQICVSILKTFPTFKMVDATIDDDAQTAGQPAEGF